MRPLSLGSILFAILAANSGCSGPKTAATKPIHVEHLDPWVIMCTDPHATTPAWLSNGLIGVRLGRDGSGVDPKTGGFFAIDEYETTGEEKIWPLKENPLVAVPLISDTNPFSPETGSYSQEQNFRTGMLTTRWTTREGVLIECQAVIHPEKRVIGQKWALETKPGTDLSFLAAGSTVQPDTRSGAPSDSVWQVSRAGMRMRTKCEIVGIEKPEWQFLNGGVLMDGRSGHNGKAVIKRVLTFGVSPNSLHMEYALTGKRIKPAKGYDDPPPAMSFDQLAKETASVWAKRWETDIEIDGPVEDQQAVRSFLFYLRSAIHPEGGMSVSPFGLSNSTYNGHVFWDADVWVFPALALIDPERAKVISEYRLLRTQAANDYFFESVVMRGQAGTGNWRMGHRFPWESSVTGREVATGEHRRQIHVIGCVAWMVNQARALGMASREDMIRVGLGAAAFYRDFSGFESGFGPRRERPRDVEWALPNVMGPDEHGLANDDLITNLLAQWTWDRYMIGKPPMSGVKKIRYHLPRDSTTFLTYDGDDLKTYQQAAAVLAIYPLQYPPAEKEARLMMERFADKVIENGPAMSDSIHAVIWARMGENEKAYETWRRSWRRYTDQPLLMFSEKPNFEQTYFVTGAAGCLQSVLYGFLGFRIDSKKDPKAAWSKQLLGGQFLTVTPHLPKAWKRVTLKNFTVLGKRYTLTATKDSLKVVEE